jgi:hypothetical protein
VHQPSTAAVRQHNLLAIVNGQRTFEAEVLVVFHADGLPEDLLLSSRELSATSGQLSAKGSIAG